MLEVVDKNRTKSNDITFTNDQRHAVDNIIAFIAAPFSPTAYAVGLIGPGGTGKTFVTNYIINHCKYVPSLIKCTSTTHKACRVFSQAIDGKVVDTIQSTFGLRPDLKLEDFNPTNPQFNPMANPKLENVRVLMIDEASMLPAGLVTHIFKVCKEHCIKVIFIGDNSQINPVNEKKSIAFQRCFATYKLNEIVRQGETNPINKLTALLRDDIDKSTYSFIKYINNHANSYEYNDINEGFVICNRDTFRHLIDKAFTDEAFKSNIDMYRVIAYTNDCVNGWNNYIRNSIIKDSDKNIITKNDLIMSYVTIVNEFLDTIITNSEEYIIKDIVNFIDTDYQFKGFLVKFQCIHGGGITKPLFIIDHRDKYTVLKYHKIVTELITAAKNSNGRSIRVNRWKQYYDFKKKYLIATNIKDSYGNTIHSRDIDYGFAQTSHRSQGSTYDIVFVDVNDMIFNKNNIPYNNQDELLRRLYVACSRARKKLILCYGK